MTFSLCLHLTGGPDLRPLCVEERRHQNPRGKTQLWNRAGTRPIVCDRLERAAQAVNPNARVWRGSLLPTDRQGIKVLGTPLGHFDFVARHLQAVVAEHQTLLDRIPRVKDLQSAGLLLHCASARANYQIRSVDPVSTAEFAQAHDDGVWQCVCNLLQIAPTQAASVRNIIASLHLCIFALGVGRVGSPSASWSPNSWRGIQPHLVCVPQHPQPSLWKVCWAGAQPPGQPWPMESALSPARLKSLNPERVVVVGNTKRLHEAASRTEQRFRDVELFARLGDIGQALLRL